MKKTLMSKILFIVLLSIIVVSCGPSPCECKKILEQSIESDFRHGQELYFSSGQEAADEWNDKVDDAVNKMLGKESNPYTGVDQIGQNEEWTKNRIIEAYNKAKKECNN
jgi:hypothetical protein